MCGTVLLLSTATLPALASPGPQSYRAHFEQGLTALAADHLDEAAAHFRAAGELAPDAPLWKAYLARALGDEPAARERATTDPRGAWALASRTWDWPVFDPTGKRLLSGNTVASLWDARTGERIAVLTHRLPDGGMSWQFDTTGRLLVGLGRTRGQPQVTQGLDVRDARTGEPIDVPGAAQAGVRLHTTFTWMPAGSRVDPADRRNTFQLALTEGVMRCTSPAESEDEISREADPCRVVWIDPDHELRLLDPADGSTLATLPRGGWKVHLSEGGRYLAWVGPEGIRVLDAHTGERLKDPPSPGAEGLRAGRDLDCAFDGEALVVLNDTGQVVFWEPRAGRELRRLTLEPLPPDRVSRFALAAGGELLIVDCWRWIAGYDSATGRRIWLVGGEAPDLCGALGPDRSSLAIRDVRGPARVLDVRTGRTRTELSELPLTVRDVEVLGGADACVVAVSDGSLRRVDLATGATTASIGAPGPGQDVTLRSLDADRLIAWSPGGALRLRDATTLTVEASVDLDPEESVLAVAPEGARVATLRNGRQVRVRVLEPEVESIELELAGVEPRCAAFSPDGARVAVVALDVSSLVDARTGKRVGQLELRCPGKPDRACFCGPDRVAVGWGDDEAVGIDVYQLPDGDLLQRIQTPECFFGGEVADLRFDSDQGLLVYSVVSCGIVRAFDASTWKGRWTIDYGGGNPSTLELQRPRRSTRLFVSGMAGGCARAVDLASGRVLAEEGVNGLFDLDGTEDGRYVVGRGYDGILDVRAWEGFERLYSRYEGPDGSAWLVRDGTRLKVVGDAGWNTRDWHLSRGGISRPADCWDAWLYDPLGLCLVGLDELPEPPRIVAGPPRELLGDRESVEVEITATSEAPLLGVQVEVAGREAVLMPVVSEPDGARSGATVHLEGPWPIDARLRAVDRRGVLSAPWRVHVE